MTGSGALPAFQGATAWAERPATARRGKNLSGSSSASSAAKGQPLQRELGCTAEGGEDACRSSITLAVRKPMAEGKVKRVGNLGVDALSPLMRVKFKCCWLLT